LTGRRKRKYHENKEPPLREVEEEYLYIFLLEEQEVIHPC